MRLWRKHNCAHEEWLALHTAVADLTASTAEPGYLTCELRVELANDEGRRLWSAFQRQMGPKKWSASPEVIELERDYQAYVAGEGWR